MPSPSPTNVEHVAVHSSHGQMNVNTINQAFAMLKQSIDDGTLDVDSARKIVQLARIVEDMYLDPPSTPAAKVPPSEPPPVNHPQARHVTMPH